MHVKAKILRFFYYRRLHGSYTLPPPAAVIFHNAHFTLLFHFYFANFSTYLNQQISPWIIRTIRNKTKHISRHLELYDYWNKYLLFWRGSFRKAGFKYDSSVLLMTSLSWVGLNCRAGGGGDDARIKLLRVNVISIANEPWQLVEGILRYNVILAQSRRVRLWRTFALVCTNCGRTLSASAHNTTRSAITLFVHSAYMRELFNQSYCTRIHYLYSLSWNKSFFVFFLV